MTRPIASLLAELARLDAARAEVSRELSEAWVGATGVPAPIEEPPARMTVRKGELAELLRVSPVTIDRWVVAGMPFCEMGSYRLFNVDEAKAWAARRTKPGRPVRRAPESRESWELPRARARRTG